MNVKVMRSDEKMSPKELRDDVMNAKLRDRLLVSTKDKKPVTLREAHELERLRKLLRFFP